MGASEGQLFPLEGIGGEVACMVALRCVGGKEVGAIHDGQQSRAGSARTIGKNSAGNGYQIGPARQRFNCPIDRTKQGLYGAAP
jgi:hypothetical protein